MMKGQTQNQQRQRLSAVCSLFHNFMDRSPNADAAAISALSSRGGGLHYVVIIIIVTATSTPPLITTHRTTVALDKPYSMSNDCLSWALSVGRAAAFVSMREWKGHRRIEHSRRT